MGWKGFYVSLQLQVHQEGILSPPCRDPPATQVASMVLWNPEGRFHNLSSCILHCCKARTMQMTLLSALALTRKLSFIESFLRFQMLSTQNDEVLGLIHYLTQGFPLVTDTGQN